MGAGGGNWSETELAGHPCDIYEPPHASPHGFVVLYLHGVHNNRLVDQAAFASEFDRHGLRMIAPRTGRSWWADRVYPPFDAQLTPWRFVLDHVVPHTAERWSTVPPAIGLLGTSMGGQAALRFAFRLPDKLPVVAAISPAIDYQIRWHEPDESLSLIYADAETARQDTATLHVHPLNWPRNIWFSCDPADYWWHESADRLRTKLVALGVPHECDLTTSGGGHSFAYYDRMAPAAIDFIAQRLERERLRVP